MKRNDPVSASELDRLFGLICRASPDEARKLAGTVPSDYRARIALFCYARTHLREVGRAIAAACDEAILALEGGQAGIALYAQRATARNESGGSGTPASRISIARTAISTRIGSDDILASAE